MAEVWNHKASSHKNYPCEAEAVKLELSFDVWALSNYIKISKKGFFEALFSHLESDEFDV